MYQCIYRYRGSCERSACCAALVQCPSLQSRSVHAGQAHLGVGRNIVKIKRCHHEHPKHVVYTAHPERHASHILSRQSVDNMWPKTEDLVPSPKTWQAANPVDCEMERSFSILSCRQLAAVLFSNMHWNHWHQHEPLWAVVHLSPSLGRWVLRQDQSSCSRSGNRQVSDIILVMSSVAETDILWPPMAADCQRATAR